MINKPEKIKDEDTNKIIQEIYNNFGLDDLKASGVSSDAPTVSTLGKGRFRVVELAGVPYIYYNTTAGVLYRWAMTAV